MAFIRNTTFSVLLLIVLGAFIPVMLILPRQHMFEVMNAVCVAASIGVCLGHVPAAWLAVRLPPHRMTAAHVAVVSIFLGSLALSGVFGIQWAWRALGKPDWLIDGWFAAFTRWLLACSLFMMLATNWSRDGMIVAGAYRRTIFLTITAVVIAIILIALGLG